MASFKKTTIKLLVELVIVFLGVVLALIGENYIEKISDRASEKVYLVELLEELEVGKEYLVDDRGRYLQLDSAAADLMGAAGASYTSKYTPCELIGRVCQLIEPDIHSAFYEDLKSSGNIKLIQNQTLRRRIVQYYQRQSYEEKWANREKDVLFTRDERSLVDLLTVDEYTNPSKCNSEPILSQLKSKGMKEILNRARKYAQSNGAQLEDRIEHNNWVVGLLKEELSKL